MRAAMRALLPCVTRLAAGLADLAEGRALRLAPTLWSHRLPLADLAEGRVAPDLEQDLVADEQPLDLAAARHAAEDEPDLERRLRTRGARLASLPLLLLRRPAAPSLDPYPPWLARLGAARVRAARMRSDSTPPSCGPIQSGATDHKLPSSLRVLCVLVCTLAATD